MGIIREKLNPELTANHLMHTDFRTLYNFVQRLQFHYICFSVSNLHRWSYNHYRYGEINIL